MAEHATIFGFGGHARVVRSLLHTRHSTFSFVTTDGVRGTTAEDAWFAGHTGSEADVYLAIGDNAARARVYDRLVAAGLTPAICVAENAFVADDASIGAGSVVCAGAVVGAGALLGSSVIVNTLSSVDHDCVVGDHAQITAGVTLGGTTTVGRGCFLGVKAATVPGVSIGDGSVVMAASLVTRDVPAGVMVGGVPARVVTAEKRRV